MVLFRDRSTCLLRVPRDPSSHRSNSIPTNSISPQQAMVAINQAFNPYILHNQVTFSQRQFSNNQSPSRLNPLDIHSDHWILLVFLQKLLTCVGLLWLFSKEAKEIFLYFILKCAIRVPPMKQKWSSLKNVPQKSTKCVLLWQDFDVCHQTLFYETDKKIIIHTNNFTVKKNKDGETKQVGSLQTGQLLNSLTYTDTVLIKQTTDVLQVLTGVRHHNQYKIKIPGVPGEGENGGPGPNKEILFAAEESGWLSRICLHSIRPFDMKIFDPFQNEVIHLKRKLGCLPFCCIPKMGQVLTVESPPGYLIGKIEQTTAFFGTEFLIKDQDDQAQLVLRAPVCRTGLLPGSSIEFKVCKIDSDEEVGRISKEWGGILREFFTDSDWFGITYPKELDIRLKAILLGATFLIDALFFDTSGREVHRAGPLSV